MTVSQYLKHTGGAELADICRDLRISRAEAVKALKAAGAHDRKYGDWPKTKPDGSRWQKFEYEVGGRFTGTYLAKTDAFTLWHLHSANVVRVADRERAA